jgi:hypothetical protein
MMQDYDFLLSLIYSSILFECDQLISWSWRKTTRDATVFVEAIATFAFVSIMQACIS